MIPLIFTLALALLSFLSSAFVILRIVVPILPPNPLSRKVPPSEFGLPNYRSLTPADKSHIWLACLDIIALAFFIWQAMTSNLVVSSNITHDSLSTARLWIALTARQTCLLFIVALTLLYVRLGRSVSFGPKHCLIWAPTLIFVGTGTGVGAVLSKVGMTTLWGGLVAYSATVAVLTTVSMGCLIGTLLLIRHNVNMAAQAEVDDKEWPPLKEKLSRHSVATEDIEALKEGSSWITSHRSNSSRQNSISAFSFSTIQHSTHGTTAPVTGSGPSVLPKSSYWFGTATPNSAALISQDSIPPVPRVPSPYRDRPSTPPPGAAYTDLSDPFHRSPPRQAKSSANSWLTSPSVSQVTLTEFSFPTTRPGSPNEHEQLTRTALTPTVYEHRISHSRATTNVQPLAESRVLGGYGLPGNLAGLSPKASKDVDISIIRCVAWTTSIWLPLGLSLPYLFMAAPAHVLTSSIAPILLTLSITLSSPLLALSLILRCPLPLPAALFSRLYSSAPIPDVPNTSVTEIRIHPEMRARSSSMTVVEGRRSGDVWIANGEAVEGRGKAARVLGLLAPSPRLAVLPAAEQKQNEGELTPPLPMQDDSIASMALSSPSANSAEMGMARTRKESKASSYYSGADESLAYRSQIMVAQRHYSHMATTVYLPPSPKFASGDGPQCESIGKALDAACAVSTGVQQGITKGHMRSQSASSSLQTPRSSMQNRFPLTPPPASPLPPTPPNVRALQHSRSQSSSGSGFSFGAIGHANQIDSLSAGVLPLLVPGLKVGRDMVLNDPSPPRSHKSGGVKARSPLRDEELGFTTSTSFNSPEMHSTPARPAKRGAENRWRHLSLPSLGLGRDGVHSLSQWKEELVRVLDGFEAKTPSTTRHRRTVHGSEAGLPTVTVQKTSSGTLNPVDEESHVEFGYAVTSDQRHASVRTFGPTPPTSASVYSDGFNTARSSMATMVEQPPTSATALLHPTFYEQQNRAPSPTHAEMICKARSYHLPIPPARKSSIVYIKSDDETSVVTPPVETDSRTSKPEPWHRRVSVKQHIPNTPKSVDGEPSPLRKLTLLGNRDLNRNGSGAGTPPLAISKKTRKQADKENGGSGLRPLKLARSATAKARGLLRQGEVLPDVVVRPPSTSAHTGFAYTFRP